ncbi:MAG: nucleoside-diphosphate sugar epimerase [Bacteroidetes bacterium]|nr:MAG: nucleoside-diphosphate sugar epimerase [Bacteroidota bacterium]
MAYKACIAGAGGLIGGELLQLLQGDSSCEAIIVLSRKEAKQEGKTTFLPFDFSDWDSLKIQLDSSFRLFCCVGTTRAKTPDLTEYKSIDHGIPLAMAKLAAEVQAQSLGIVSALGANPKSGNFYNRIKGEMEQDVMAVQFHPVYFARPALLLGNRKEKRSAEAIAQAIFRLINPLFVGPLAAYKAVEGRAVAKALFTLANGQAADGVYLNDALIELGAE